MGKRLGGGLAAGVFVVTASVGAVLAPRAASASDGGSVSAGVEHTCSVQSDATVLCWGSNSDGQLGTGNGDPGPVVMPVSVAGLQDAVAVAVGDRFSCALRTSGRVACWGLGTSGQLGNGAPVSSRVPIDIPQPFLDSVVAISAGGDGACALRADGRVSCWGFVGLGRLGEVVLTGASAISVGNRFACALVSGTIRCWGEGSSGQLGNGASLSVGASPVSVAGITKALYVSAGDRHACTFADNGVFQQAMCWGDNSHGELGNGTTTSSNVPVAVSDPRLSPIAGGDLTCAAGPSPVALFSYGIFCWGDTSGGVLRSSTAVPQTTVPTFVEGSSDWHLLTVGAGHICAVSSPTTNWVRNATSAFCWGRNGQGQAGPVGGTLMARPLVESLDTIPATRVLDTRPGVLVGYNGAKPGPGSTVVVSVAARVPGLLKAVSLNVTGTEATAAGFVTVWPCDQPRPLASTLNLVPGEDRANFALVPVSVAGTVCVYSQSGAHLVVDLTGFLAPTSPYVAISPRRLGDSRIGNSLEMTATSQPGLYRLFPSSDGSTPLAPDGSTLALNVTAVGARAAGFVTVWPCADPRPTASNLNVGVGETLPVGVLAHAGATSQVCLYTNSGADIVVDLNGWFAPGEAVHSIAGVRVLDTRADSRVGYTGLGKPAAGVTTVSFASVPGIGTAGPTDSLLLSLTATEADADGFVRVGPCSDSATGPVSNVNVTKGGTRANLALVAYYPLRETCITTNVATHLVVDVQGWVPLNGHH